MQPHVHEVGRRYLPQHRPARGSIGNHQRDAVRRQNAKALGVVKTVVANLERVTQWMLGASLEKEPVIHSLVFVTAERQSLGRVLRQLGAELLEYFGVERDPLGQLPEHRAEFLAEGEHPRGEEVGQRLVRVLQLQHVRDETPALHREHEIGRRLALPAQKARRALQRVERAVDLDGVEPFGGIRELVRLGEPLRVERRAPRRVAPARDADERPAHATALLTSSREPRPAASARQPPAPAPDATAPAGCYPPAACR